MKNLIIIGLSIAILSSCKGSYGLKKTIPVSKDNIDKISALYEIKETYVLEKKPYIAFLKSVSKDSSFVKNHTQPLQAIYFNENGEMESYYLNCYAGGFPNLIWNKANSLDIFPPKSQTKVDTDFPLDKFLEYFKIEKSKQKEKYVFLFWNDYLGRQTKRFINEFRNNINKSTNGKVNIIYVNNDNLYVD